MLVVLFCHNYFKIKQYREYFQIISEKNIRSALNLLLIVKQTENTNNKQQKKRVKHILLMIFCVEKKPHFPQMMQ